MGKRSDFKRVKNDKYITPIEGVNPFAHYFGSGKYVEPCAAKGQLIEKLKIIKRLKCSAAFDIGTASGIVKKRDALTLKKSDLKGAKKIITNPPWKREILHKMIEHFMNLVPEVWLLFDADWPHTKQSADLIKHCKLIISVGRLKWIPKSKSVGKDNCCWYLFSKRHTDGPKFIGRKK
jgi:hypothetical protein